MLTYYSSLVAIIFSNKMPNFYDQKLTEKGSVKIFQNLPINECITLQVPFTVLQY